MAFLILPDTLSIIGVLLDGVKFGGTYSVGQKQRLSCTTKIPIQDQVAKQVCYKITQSCSLNNGQQLYGYVLVLCPALTPCANVLQLTCIIVITVKRRVACDVRTCVRCVCILHIHERCTSVYTCTA